MVLSQSVALQEQVPTPDLTAVFDLVQSYRLSIKRLRFTRITDRDVEDLMETYTSEAFAGALGGRLSDEVVAFLSMLLFERVPHDVSQRFFSEYLNRLSQHGTSPNGLA